MNFLLDFALIVFQRISTKVEIMNVNTTKAACTESLRPLEQYVSYCQADSMGSYLVHEDSAHTSFPGSLIFTSQ